MRTVTTSTFAATALMWGLATGCSSANSAPASTKAPQSQERVRVHAQRLPSASIARTERRSARVEPRRQVRLAFGVPGRVTRIAVDEGDRVKKGALLAAVDTRALTAQLARAQAGLDQAEREAKRGRALRAKSAVTSQRVDQLESALAVAKAGLEAAYAQLDQARIRAPFAADVVGRMGEPGAWANPGVPVLVLAELNPIRVVAQVPDQVRPTIKPGASVQIEARGLSQPRTGIVIRVSPVVDERTGLFRVEIDVDNEDRRLAAGQPVEVAIQAGTLDDAVVLLPEWLVYRHEGPAVVVVDGGKARTVILSDDLARIDGKFVVSKASLPDLPVITKGQTMVREGRAVEVVSAAQAEAAR